MNCEQCTGMIEAYFDGELTAEAAARVAQHMAVCDACQGEYETLRFEQTEIYSGYQRSIELTPALWSAVQQRIELEKDSN